MTGYDFVVDTGKLNDFVTGLEDYYQNLSDEISELKTFFGEGNAEAKWSGEAYNNLKAKYDTSAKSYDAVLSYISTYKGLVSNVEELATTLCADIVAACDIE